MRATPRASLSGSEHPRHNQNLHKGHCPILDFRKQITEFILRIMTPSCPNPLWVRPVTLSGMRVIVGWIMAATLLAVTLLGALSVQYVASETAVWMVISVAVAAGLGATITAAGSMPAPGGKGQMLAFLRSVLSVAAGVVAFVGIVPAGCNDVPGPVWERCVTFIGTPPVLEWTVLGGWPLEALVALAFGLGLGYLVWLLTGLLTRSH